MFRFLRQSIWLKRFVGDLPIIGRRYRNWVHYQHPCDRELSIETSGYVSEEEIARETGRSGLVPYAGSQPSTVRRILARFPEPETFTLIDLGCGKGRMLAVASEFPFRRIVGVELVPSLAALARQNAGTIAARFSRRTRIEVLQMDALQLTAEGRVIFFNYHALPRESLAQFIARIEAQLDHAIPHAFFAYLNPVCADLLDQSPRWTRWATDHLIHEKHELLFGFGHPDAVVIWQSLPNAYPPHPQANRQVVIKDVLWQAELETKSND